jgi:hypothetical protein
VVLPIVHYNNHNHNHDNNNNNGNNNGNNGVGVGVVGEDDDDDALWRKDLGRIFLKLGIVTTIGGGNHQFWWDYQEGLSFHEISW